LQSPNYQGGLQSKVVNHTKVPPGECCYFPPLTVQPKEVWQEAYEKDVDFRLKVGKITNVRYKKEIKMRPIFYSFVYIVPAVTVVGLLLGGPWLLLAPLIAFGIIPIAELILPAPRSNPGQEESKERLSNWGYDAVIYMALPVQFLLITLLASRIGSSALVGMEIFGAILSVGLCCGALGINVGHELGHRTSRRHQLAAKVILSTSLYAHFFIEHNRGHHAQVATAEDPATSRKGEWLQAFWLRSIVGGYLGAWKLEAHRLGRRGQSPWTWNNEMLRLQFGQAILLLALYAVFGTKAMLAFMGASLVGALLLETVNYVEHYGLLRLRTASGKWARVAPEHSWNSNSILGRLLLFELTRHSDHHAYPKRPYSVLRHFDESPQLPTGYPGMILLALVPPVFFAVMDHRIPNPHPAQALSTA
jgi:alkane 1-monooxygenase